MSKDKYRLSYDEVRVLAWYVSVIYQVRAFLSAWLGGILREVIRDYMMIWMFDVCLSFFTSVMSLRIERN